MGGLLAHKQGEIDGEIVQTFLCSITILIRRKAERAKSESGQRAWSREPPSRLDDEQATSQWKRATNVSLPSKLTQICQLLCCRPNLPALGQLDYEAAKVSSRSNWRAGQFAWSAGRQAGRQAGEI